MSANRRPWYALLAASLLLFAAFPVTAQEQDPNSPGYVATSRGFAADKAFQMGDFDNVNVFNGNMILTLPVGPTFPVAGNLSYGLNLVYNSKIWPGKEKRVDQLQREYYRATAEKISNAGFGWLLSMGRLYLGCPQQPCLPFPQQAGLNTYESPDGALHSFYATLHESGDGSSPAGVLGYTRDSSYLRLRSVTGGYEVDFPDGTVRHFVPVSGTYTAQLTEIRDTFGNRVSLAWNGANWTFGDTHTGRADRWQNVTSVPMAGVQSNFSNLISQISYTAQGGRTLLYKFTYNDGALDTNQNPAAVSVKRGCLGAGGPGSEWPNDDGLIAVALLTKLEVIDAAAPSTALQTYTFQYADSTTCAASALVGMTLPTGGAVTWSYDTYSLPSSACGEGDPDLMEGVRFRDLWSNSSCTDRTNGACNAYKVGEWKYESLLVRNYAANAQVNCNDANFPPRMVTATESEVVNTVTAPDGSKAKHHFSVWNARPDAPDGARRDEYGLPFGRSDSLVGPSGPRYISGEQQDCSSTCTTKQSSYVLYERDDPTSYLYSNNCNRRIVGNRTVYPDDLVSGSARYKDTAFSVFDGLGHYRTASVTGNFTTPGDSRVETTNFNPSCGIYPGTFVLPSSWLIQTYSEQTAQEHGSAAKKTFTWETNGALSAVRTLKSSAAAPASITTDVHDLLTVYCRDSYGNVVSERYFGGDNGTVGSQNCNSTPVYSAGEYQINHSYSAFGPLEKSWYSNVSTQYIVDQTVDDKSALPSSSRDICGLQTTYTYDILGRMTAASPPGAAWSEYIYKLPGETYGSTTIAQPTLFMNLHAFGSSSSSTPLRQEKYEFDQLGRLIRQGHLSASNVWVASETAYDGMGRKVWVSEPESTGSSAPTSPLTAALKTTFTYDAFGRQTNVTLPDTSTTSFSYTGVSHNERTTSVATSSTTNTTVVTKYDYDAFGRLVHVDEPSGPSSSTSPVGQSVNTNYGYDVGGRLSSVEMKAAEQSIVQNRIFDYDRRGFLQWEVHPESGMSTYTYDARGNMLTKRQAAASTQFDLNYTYDSAGRILRVDGRNPSYDPNSSFTDNQQQFRKIKEFTYADSNDTSVTPGNYRQGKLWTAARYNYTPPGTYYTSGSLYNAIIRVTETYKYADAAGRKTHRTMDIDSTDSVTGGTWANAQSIDQDVSYNDLDMPATIQYPTCINCGLPAYAPERNVSPTYDQGQITSVPSFVDSISYWSNGMRNQLVHSNNVVDTQYAAGRTSDSRASLARPFELSTGLYDACAPPVIINQPSGGQITSSNTSVTLSVAVNGTSPAFQWYTKDGAQTTLIPGATGSTYVASPMSTTYYFVAVTNSCRTLNSNTARVSVNECVAPTATASLTLNPDRTVSLSVRGTGTEPFTYTWYRASDNAVIGNTAALTVGPISATTGYYAKVASPCAGSPATSATVMAVIPLVMPSTGLVATKTGTNQITITWPAVSGAGRYHLERRSGAGWVDLTADPTIYTSTSYVDNDLTANVTYAYRVWASPDASNSSKSAYSNVDIATIMTFTSVASGTIVRSTHLDELLQAVNSVRAAAGWAAVTWSNILASNQPLPLPGTAIVPAHILATRARINEALQALGVAAGGYTDPDPSLKVIKAIHITEVQGRAQ